MPRLAPKDIFWLRQGDTKVLGLHCRSRGHVPPFQYAVALLQWSQLVRLKEEVEWNDELNPDVEAFLKRDLELTSKCWWSVKAHGTAAFGVGRTRLACERAAYLALAITACLETNDCGPDMAGMVDAVRRRMQESEPRQVLSGPRSSLQPKRRPRPPFYALSDRVQPKARPNPPVILIDEDERSRSPIPQEEIPYQVSPRLTQSQVRWSLFAQHGADWDPSKPEWNPEKWASKLRRCDLATLKWSHGSIGEKFRNGPHAGQPIWKLVNDLKSGKVATDEVTALVGLEDMSGEIWVLCGNRRLKAYKTYEEHAQKQVITYVVVFRMAETDSFPASLHAKIYEAMKDNEHGSKPRLR